MAARKSKSLKKTKKKNQNQENRYFAVLSSLIVILLAVLAFSLWAINKQNSQLDTYELLERIDNQACRYLDGQRGVNGGFNYEPAAALGQPVLNYTCLTGDDVEAKKIHGKHIGSYSLGASVSYFATNEEAIKYAQERLNPLRFWGVDEEGQKNGIPQTSKFTFIVNDVEFPYFDAYTVKANAVLRVSLPCGDPDVKNGGVACYAEAENIFDRELKGFNAF